jgi:PmbA protein
MEKILDLAGRSADAAEVLCVESESRRAEFENNRLKYITTKSVRGVGLRVICNGRIGFSSTTDLSRPERLVEHALESAKYGQEAKFEFPACSQPAAVGVYDPRVVDFPVEEGAKATEAAIGTILTAYPRAQCGGDVVKQVGKQRIINTSGLDISFEYTQFSCCTSALLVRDGNLLWVGDHESSCALLDVWEEQADKAIADIRSAEREVVPEPGTYPVIFTPDAIGSLLDTFEQGTNGKLVQKEMSPLTGKLGEQIVDNRITITDDATLDFAAGSCPVDDEGLAARRNVLIENGVLKQYLFDLQTAGMMNAAPTGNGMRGFQSQPSPGNTNLAVNAGDMPYEKMLVDMKRGLVADQLLGAGQSNILAGEFSVNVDLGYLVENGEIVGRAKDCMVAGNVFEAFNSIIALGDRSALKGSLKAPHFYFAGLNVASG